MPDKRIEHDTNVEMQTSAKHLCSLMLEGFHYTHPDEYKQIVQNAQFRCENCGRTSNQQDQVCNPVTL